MMYSTRIAARKLRDIPGIKDKLDMLRNIYKGQTCYLVAGGPSTGHFKPSTLLKQMNGHPTIAVKHALSVLPFADIHILNQYKYVPYSYPAEKPLVIATTQSHRAMPTKNCDIILPLQAGKNHQETISARGTFGDFTLDKQVKRAWGPSIIFELGVYLAVHTGVSELITLGVDFVDAPHFWSGTLPKTEGSKREAILSEYATIKAALPGWYAWLRSQGVEWKFIGTPYPTALTGIVPSIEL